MGHGLAGAVTVTCGTWVFGFNAAAVVVAGANAAAVVVAG
jgi:hypothetical protein